MRELSVAARDSLLSKAQVKELFQELRVFYPDLRFTEFYVKTTGDIDLKTSLKNMGKTDFFTREVDEAVLNNTCCIAVHSAKDLPEQIPQGLTIAAITEGVDSSDALVLREGLTLHTLPAAPRIAASSTRREESVHSILPSAILMDIRGTIPMRLERLDSGEFEGVVVAEAALIRLGLTHRNRIRLPGETTPLQGQLAIIARSEDDELLEMMKVIDQR